MTVLDSSGVAKLNDARCTGSCDMLEGATAIIRAHAHMPRRRKSISPQRASGGRGWPRAALRSASYCDTTAASRPEASPPVGISARFFLPQLLARSSSGGHRDEISARSVLPGPALEWARPLPVALG